MRDILCNKLSQRFKPWLNVLYIGYFSKRNRKPAKFQQALLLNRMKYTSKGPLCLFILLDVSLTSVEQVLGRTYDFAYGESSGFFCVRMPPSINGIYLTKHKHTIPKKHRSSEMRREKMQSLRVVPVDGDMTHILELSLKPGNARAFQIKRDMLMMAKDIAVLKQCGIYFLYGEAIRDGKLVRKVYVGQAVSRKNGEGVFWRVKEHDSDKPAERFWTDAIAFVDRNNEWGPTEISYLENRFANLIAVAKEGSTFFELANGNTPNPGNVTKDTQWELESYVEDAITILQTLRYDFFSREEDSEPSLLDESSSDLKPTPILSKKGKDIPSKASADDFPVKVGQVMSIAFRKALEEGLLKDEISFLKSPEASRLFKTGKYRIVVQGEMPEKDSFGVRRYAKKPAFYAGKRYWITTQIWERGLEALLAFLEKHGMSRSEIISLCNTESPAQEKKEQHVQQTDKQVNPIQPTLWDNDVLPSSNSKKDKTSSRAPKTSFSVSFSDGTMIQGESAAETFAKAINHIGPEKVEKLGLTIAHEPLISQEGSKKYAHSNHLLSNGHYLITHSNTQTKKDYLNKISALLGCKFEISEKSS